MSEHTEIDWDHIQEEVLEMQEILKENGVPDCIIIFRINMFIVILTHNFSVKPLMLSSSVFFLLHQQPYTVSRILN